MNPAQYLAIKLIQCYKVCVSPFLGKHCRFEPTCSAYTQEAIQKYGFVKGCYMGACRILHCHPWGGSGYAPVPEKKEVYYEK